MWPEAAPSGRAVLERQAGPGQDGGPEARRATSPWRPLPAFRYRVWCLLLQSHGRLNPPCTLHGPPRVIIIKNFPNIASHRGDWHREIGSWPAK